MSASHRLWRSQPRQDVGQRRKRAPCAIAAAHLDHQQRADEAHVDLQEFGRPYAIVNSRLFDLRVGRLILVAPQKDGSIRFHQTDAPTMNSVERDMYIENLKTE
jgi:hypothetical protein